MFFWRTIISFSHWIVLSLSFCLDISVFIHLSLWVWLLSHFFIFSALLPKVKKKRVIRPSKCALCVLHQSVWNVSGCEVCVYAWTGFICDGTSHTYSQLGKLVRRGNKSCNLLILLGAFTSLNKNSVISAFMGFIWRVTILRPRRWSSQRVKWREGRRSDTRTLPPPSLSPPISITSWSPLLSLTLQHFNPLKSRWHDLLKVQFITAWTVAFFVVFLVYVDITCCGWESLTVGVKTD